MGIGFVRFRWLDEEVGQPKAAQSESTSAPAPEKTASTVSSTAGSTAN